MALPDSELPPRPGAETEGAELLAQLQDERALNDFLLALGPTLNAASTLREAIDLLLNAACKHLSYAVGHARLTAIEASDGAQGAELWHFAGNPERFSTFRGATESESAPLLPDVETRSAEAPDWIRDVREEPTFSRKAAAAEAGLAARVAFQVRDGNQLLALVELFRTKPGQPSARHLETFDLVCQQLGSVCQRLREQRLLRAREEHLQAMIDAEPTCIKLIAPDGTLLEMNNSGLAMLDALHADELVGRSIFSIVHPRFHESLERFHQQVLQGVPGSFQCEIVGLRGTRRWTESHSALLRTADGEARHLAVSVDITERRRAEEVIRYIASNARCLLWHADVEERGEERLHWQLRVSDEQAAQRFFPLHVIPGTEYASAWYRSRPQEDQERTDTYGNAQIRMSRSYSQEFRAVDRTGKLRWMHEDVHVEPTGPGRWRAVGICTDVTAHREAEAELRAREELLNQVLDTLPVGVWVADARGVIIRGNPAGQRIWGGARYVGPEDYGIYQGWWAATGERITPGDWAAARAVSRGETSLNEEIIIQCFDGSQKTILNSAVPLRSADGRVTGAIVVNEDITQRKRAERRDAAFRTLGAQLNAALSPAEAARIIVSVADDLLGWEACWLELVDLDSMKVDPMILIDEVKGERREVACPTNELLETSLTLRAIKDGPLLLSPEPGEGEEDLDERLRFGDCERISQAIMVVPIRLGSRAIGALSIQSYTPDAYDRTDLDTLQALADYCAAALDRTRAEAQRQSLEHQLRQSQKLEAIGQLAGGVAHDFNNMLAVISGYCELLLSDQPREDRDRAAIQEIHAASQRAADLTQQLLAFSRKSIVQPVVLSVNEVVQGMERMLERLIGEDIRLYHHLAPHAGKVRVDRSQLDQVLLNLAVNARDAMPTGGALRIETQAVQVERGADSDLAPGSYVLITVTDTGCGMSPETLAHIWEPFFTTKPTGEGTGLGLATVYGIVKQHGGHVAVQSRPDEGTTFRIYLPRLPESEDSIEAAKRSTEQAPLTVLVVEDEEMLRRLITLVLTQSGFRTLEAADGEEALRVVEETTAPIHLVLTDLVLPGAACGATIARTITERRPGTRVLMMSGYVEEEVGGRPVSQDSTVFIQKPFTPAALLQKVQETITG